jgi:formiminotetrahydrofolate cyclodeaminase
MLEPYHHNIKHLTIYQKSLDIFQLSRRIAAYITDDKDMISMYRSGTKTDNYADNLVMNAYRLVPKIAETESQENAREKLKYAESLKRYIDVLYKNCRQLESTRIPGKEFIGLLRKELVKLSKIHRRYVNSLL